jgi:hypothetical protein
MLTHEPYHLAIPPTFLPSQENCPIFVPTSAPCLLHNPDFPRARNPDFPPVRNHSIPPARNLDFGGDAARAPATVIYPRVSRSRKNDVSRTFAD